MEQAEKCAVMIGEMEAYEVGERGGVEEWSRVGIASMLSG